MSVTRTCHPFTSAIRGPRRTNVMRATGVLLATSLIVVIGSAADAAPRMRPPDSYAFKSPSSVAVVHNDLFVANSGGNSVTEVNDSTGDFVALLRGARYRFDEPSAITAVGGDLFVANQGGDSLTEFVADTGALVRTFSGSTYGLADPIALAARRNHLFVLNGTGSVTEVATNTGRDLGTASGPAYAFDQPTALAVAGDNVFVTNSAGNTVTEFSAHNRALVQVLSDTSYGFDDPLGVAFDGTNLWVTNSAAQTVTEIAPETGAVVAVLSSPDGYFPMIGPVVTGDGYVFVISPPGSSPMVTQITPSTGTANWMMCNTNGPYLFNNPESAVVTGSNLWVVNEGGNSLTEMDASSGALLQTVS